MTVDAFLDKGVILGYCFLVDPAAKECRRYVSAEGKQLYATEHVERVFQRKRDEILERQRNGVLSHCRELRTDYSGTLSEEDVSELRSGVDRYENDAWRYLEDYYEGKVGESVTDVDRELRGLARGLEKLAEERREELYERLIDWIRFRDYSGDEYDLHDELSGLKAEDRTDDFRVVLDAHDVGVECDGVTELATNNPTEFADDAYGEQILTHTEIDRIELLFESRSLGGDAALWVVSREVYHSPSGERRLLWLEALSRLVTRISHVGDDEASERVRAIFGAAEDQFGLVPNVARTMGHSDAVADGFVGTEGELFGTGELGHELLEKVGVAVSASNDCSYCVDAHSLSLLRNVDATEEEIDAITTGQFEELPEREAIATAFAAAAADDPQAVDEELYEDLTEEFSDAEITEIVGTAALFEGINLFADALEVDPDQ